MEGRDLSQACKHSVLQSLGAPQAYAVPWDMGPGPAVCEPQVHSGGLLRATPHGVRAASGPAAAGVSRNTFAVFMQPKWDTPMAPPPRCDDAAIGIGAWLPGMTFGDFAEVRRAGHAPSPASPCRPWGAACMV